MSAENFLSGLIAGFLIALTAAIFIEYFGVSKIDPFWAFVIVDLAFIFFVGIPFKFPGTVILSIGILFIGYLAYGPYSGYLRPIFHDVGKTFERIPANVEKTVHCLTLLFTNPMAYTEECVITQPKEAPGEKPEYANALEATHFEIIPQKLYPGNSVAVTMQLENKGDFDAENVTVKLFSREYERCDLKVLDLSKAEEFKLGTLKKGSVKFISNEGFVNNPWGDDLEGKIESYDEPLNCSAGKAYNVSIKLESGLTGYQNYTECSLSCEDSKPSSITCSEWECEKVKGNWTCTKKMKCDYVKYKPLTTGSVGFEVSYRYKTESYTPIKLLREINLQKEEGAIGEVETSFVKSAPAAIILATRKALVKESLGMNKASVTVTLKNREGDSRVIFEKDDEIKIYLLNKENRKYLNFSCREEEGKGIVNCSKEGNNITLTFKEKKEIGPNEDLPSIYQFDIRLTEDFDKDELEINLMAEAEYRVITTFEDVITVQKPFEPSD